MIDVGRLQVQLLRTQLQNKDNPLYQLLKLMIDTLGSLDKITAAVAASGDTNLTTIIQQYLIMEGSAGGGEDPIPVPGPIGPTGAGGSQGPMGQMGAILYPPDAEDGDHYPPIVGPQGNPGPTGSGGPVGPTIIAGDEVYEEYNMMSAPVAAGSLVFLGARTASASAQLDFNSLISSLYNTYIFEIENILPANDNVDLLLRCSTDNGATFDSGSNYEFADYLNNTAAFSTNSVSSASATAIKIMPTIDFGSTTGGVNGNLKLINPLNAAQHKGCIYQAFARLDDTNTYNGTGMGNYKSTTAVNAIRFLMSSGNIASGTIRLYGIAKA